MAKEGKPSSLRLTGAFKKMIELLMRARHFNDRTAYFEQLVRDDWDKRVSPQMEAELTALLEKENAALALNERPVKPLPPVGAPAPVQSHIGRAKGKRNRKRGQHPPSN